MYIYTQKEPTVTLSPERIKAMQMQYTKEADIGGAVLESAGHASVGLLASYLSSLSLNKTTSIVQGLKNIDPLAAKLYLSRLPTRIKVGSAFNLQLGGLVWAAAIQPLYFAYKYYQINKKYASQLPLSQISNPVQRTLKGLLIPAYVPLAR
jgi:hypothetical protein